MISSFSYILNEGLLIWHELENAEIDREGKKKGRAAEDMLQGHSWKLVISLQWPQ